jgi:hypothetical protein
MGKNLYERRQIREAKAAARAGLAPPHSVKWHERNVVRRAELFCQVFVTSVGFGTPVARAGKVLNEAVERLHAARSRVNGEAK